jgi:hypothetical protein
MPSSFFCLRSERIFWQNSSWTSYDTKAEEQRRDIVSCLVVLSGSVFINSDTWEDMLSNHQWRPTRLLARVLKDGVQFWYNETSTVKRGGGGGGGGGGGVRVRESVPLENLWSLRYFMSVSVPSLFEIFQTHLALWVCAAMLLYLTKTFSFSQVHHQIDQNV